MNQSKYQRLLVLGRLSGIAWSCLGAWLVFLWGRELGGPRAALIALTIWCFDPNIVAHAQIISSDLPGATTVLLAAWYFRRYLQQSTWCNLFLAAVTLGLALLTKFTLLVLVPVWLVLLLVGRTLGVPRRWSRRWGQTVVAAVVTLVVIMAGYEFTKLGVRLGEFEFVSENLGGDRPPKSAATALQAGNRFRGTVLERIPVLLPADYLYGIDVQWRDFDTGRRSTSSFLAGEMKAGGWWYYYLYGMAIKTPLGFLALLLGGLLYGWCRVSRWREALLLSGPAIAILTLVSSQTGFNHHVRYVLPALPFLIVGAGWFGAALLQRSRWLAVLVVGCLVWGVGSHLRYYPHSLSYFNELVGGPENGYKYLIDSNIDWGQDLLLLQRWEAKHPDRPLRYALFTSVKPHDWGLAGGPAIYTTALERAEWDQPPAPGWYAISVTLLQGRPSSNGRLPEHVRQVFLRQQPVDRVGYSILLFHLEP